MPKKVTKEINIDVSNKDDQGFWILKENKRKGERAIKTKGNKVLVKRNRSGYDYNKTISGYEWTKAELDKKLAERAKQGMMEKKSILRDLTHTHRNTKTAPIVTASDIFDNDDWNKQDVLGVDTPPGMTLKEIVAKYRAEKKPEVKTQRIEDKEIWELTKTEYNDALSATKTNYADQGVVKPSRAYAQFKARFDKMLKLKDELPAKFDETWNQERTTHKDIVAKYILEGKKIPAEVMKDYPELVGIKEWRYNTYKKDEKGKLVRTEFIISKGGKTSYKGFYESSDKLIEAKLDDIDKHKASSAYSFTSWDSEKRGEEERRHYVRHVNEFHDELVSSVPPERHVELKEALEQYKEQYRSKTLEQLYRRGGLASSAVVGRSNFPVSSQKKKSGVFDRKQQEFYEWDGKVQNRIRRQFGLAGGKGISSDDPTAIQQIDTKLTKLKARQAKMKVVNKIVKSKSTSDNVKRKDLKELGYTDHSINEFLKGDFAGRVGFPSYELSNNRANIRRLEQRKEDLTNLRSQKTSSQDFGNVRIEKNIEDNRLRILFDDIPSVEIRSKLKSRGFRWSPKNKAWQKMISNQADYESKEIVEEYNQEVKEKITPETKLKEKIDRTKSIAAGKNLYQEKYSPGKTHLAKTKTMTDMQKRRLIKACIDNEVDTRELDPSLKYDENQEIIQDMIEADDSQYRDESSKIDKKIAKLETVYYDDFGKERIKEREIDGKTTEEKVITKKDLSKNRKKTQLNQWKKEPYKSKIDVEEIDTGPKEKKKLEFEEVWVNTKRIGKEDYLNLNDYVEIDITKGLASNKFLDTTTLRGKVTKITDKAIQIDGELWIPNSQRIEPPKVTKTKLSPNYKIDTKRQEQMKKVDRLVEEAGNKEMKRQQIEQEKKLSPEKLAKKINYLEKRQNMANIRLKEEKWEKQRIETKAGIKERSERLIRLKKLYKEKKPEPKVTMIPPPSPKTLLKRIGSELPKPYQEYGKLNYRGSMVEFDRTIAYLQREKATIMVLTDLTSEDFDKLRKGSRADQMQRYDKVRKAIWSSYYNS